MAPHTTLTAHQRRQIAVIAVCDDRTVDSYLDGRPVRQTVAIRVAQALVTLGLAAHIRSDRPVKP